MERFDLETAFERLKGKVKTLALSDHDIANELRLMAATIEEFIEEELANGRKCGHCGAPSRSGICGYCFVSGHRFTECGTQCKPSTQGEALLRKLSAGR